MLRDDREPSQASRLTRRGLATRDRIVRAAATLMYTKGVHATTLDDVRVVSGTSKSQLYRHFTDKSALVQEVISLQAHEVMTRQRRRLERLNSIRGLELWRDDIVRRNALQNGAYGCEFGSLAGELAEQDETARASLNDHFIEWQGILSAGFVRMIHRGVLRSDADPDRLAVGVMAALQGGHLLAQTARDVAPLKVALDVALEHVKSFAVMPHG